MSCYYLLYGITIHTVHVIYRRQDTGTYDSYDFWKRSKFLLSISTSHVKMLCSTWNSMRLLAHQASAPLCSTSNFFSLFVPTTQFLERRHIAWGSDSCPFLVTKMIILVVMLQLTKVEINALRPSSSIFCQDVYSLAFTFLWLCYCYSHRRFFALIHFCLESPMYLYSAHTFFWLPSEPSMPPECNIEKT